MSAPGTVPDQLVEALLAAGWEVVGQRAGLYKRLAVVGEFGNKHMFVVPLNPEYADYNDLMNAVLRSLEDMMFAGKAARVALNRFNPELYQ